MAFSRLGRVLDIEWLLSRDEGRDAEEVAREDRRLLEGTAPADPEAALGLWLDGRRRELDERTLGVRVSEGLTALHAALFSLACAAGAGTAGALLEGPPARAPTNVLHFVLVTLAWPLALLLLSLLLLLARGHVGRSVLLEDVSVRALGAVGRFARQRAGADWDLGHEWRRLRRGARRYRDIELCTMLSAAQWYPLGFHLGAAFGLAASALFSDLAFAWSTTDDSLSSSTVAAVFGALTAPWCEGLGVGCVGPELVRATQFSRFTGSYALPEGAGMSGAWWPALFSCLVVYGVLPRLAFALALRGVVARRAARLSERVLELRARLRAGVAVVTAPARPGSDRPAPAPAVAPHPSLSMLGSRECWVIRWRGAPIDDAEEAALCGQLGLRALRRDAAGGSDFEHDLALIEGGNHGDAAVLLIVEGWEAPDKATRRFVQALRARGPGERPVFVAVLLESADAPELALWQDRLRLLEDPFVSVQAHVPARAAALRSSEGVG